MGVRCKMRKKSHDGDPIFELVGQIESNLFFFHEWYHKNRMIEGAPPPRSGAATSSSNNALSSPAPLPGRTEVAVYEQKLSHGIKQSNQSIEDLTAHVTQLETEIAARRLNEAALEKQLAEAKQQRFTCVHTNALADAQFPPLDALPN